jgi:hypothetical protein
MAHLLTRGLLVLRVLLIVEGGFGAFGHISVRQDG